MLSLAGLISTDQHLILHYAFVVLFTKYYKKFIESVFFTFST